jgi:hypothetical protein
VADCEPGQEAELHGLLSHAERARNHRLRRDHRRRRGEQHHWYLGPSGQQQKERVHYRFRGPQNQRALRQVVQRQRREDDQEPRAADRAPAEVAHVGVECLRSGDSENH